jgi:hypothetical protein
MWMACRLLFAIAILPAVMAPVGPAAVQTLPSPSDAPPGGAPTPGMFPMTGVPRPAGGEASPCMADFARLREDVEK